MRGDFSRLTFKPINNYSGVYWQQGRPVTDADKNEAQDIATYRTETEAIDVIGRSGAPKENSGFGLSIDSDGNVVIGQGHYYVDGILCENDQPVIYSAQPYLPDPPAFSLEDAAVGLVYLEVFKRHLTFQDDASIRDVALNEVDTTTRLQTVWQVKLLPLALSVSSDALTTLTSAAEEIESLTDQIAEATDPDARADLIRLREVARRQFIQLGEDLNVRCDGNYPEWDALIAPPTGALQVTTIPAGTATEPCDVPPGGGYTRGENQFYRVEVHSLPLGGGRDGATFKWSRDNGSIVARIEAVGNNTTGTHSGTIFDVDSVGRDDYLSIHTDDWVEYIDDSHELNGVSGVLVQVQNADVNLNRIELQSSLTVNLDRHPKLRKWDQAGTGVGNTGVAMNTTNTPVALESGLQVEFSDGLYRPGDYWQFAARAVTGQHDFPPGAQARFGVVHHYARLGLVAFGPVTDDDDNQLRVLIDCRDLFPPLTAITAADVSYDDTACNLGDVRTVQEAIEALCQRSGGHCTIHLSPDSDLAAILTAIPDTTDAHICFEVGRYQLPEPINLQNKGHLVLEGAGPGTRLVAVEAETALLFNQCQSVTLRDLSVESRQVSSSGGLNGALTFIDCGAVTLEGVELRCAGSLARNATCLTIRNNATTLGENLEAGQVRVLHCNLFVGHLQTGILAVNTNRLTVEDNFINVAERPDSLNLAANLENRGVRNRLRRLMISNLTIGERREDLETNVTLTIGDEQVHFLTDQRLRSPAIWESALRLRPDALRDTPQRTLYALADTILLNQTGLEQNFRNWFRAVEADDAAVASQGIVVGGTRAQDVRILYNTIECALQGIHVGLSRSDPSQEIIESARHVMISGNTVRICIPSSAVRERHGIFVGSGESMVIENNYVTSQRSNSTSRLRLEGIRAFGRFGRRLIIRQNHTASTGSFVGIRVTPLNGASPPQPIWVVSDNVASTDIDDARVHEENNFA